MKVPFFAFLKGPEQDALKQTFEKVIQSGVYLLGEELQQFEKQFSDFCNVQFTSGVGSGYDALYIGLRALGLQKGDQVIVPAHTFVASWHAVVNAGLQIVPVDVDIQSFNIDTNLLAEVLTPNCKAIMPVHMYGQTCRMDYILHFCAENKLLCIEDFAQSHGALFQGKKAGSIGDVGATSFYPVKNLGALGDGGAITTNSKQLYESAKLLRNYGSEQKYYYTEIGVNSRMGELQAAFLKVKLTNLDWGNQKRREIAKRYREELKSIEQLTLPSENKDCFHVYHLFVVLSDNREELKAFLNKKGIETLIHYPVPPHLQKAYEFMRFEKGDFPVAERIAREALSLPCHPGLSQNEQEYIIETIKEYYR